MSPASITVQICSVAELGDEARALQQEDQPPQEYLNLLVEKGHFQDAVRFLAYALPKREAVWWAWVCARRAAGAEPAPNIKASLDATESWVAQPTDENRRAAMSAFFSGGSMAPPGAQAVPPGVYLTSKAVAVAVILAAVAGEPEETPANFRTSVEQGVDVVKRIQLW